ncbi:MAG: FolM Alternative dihydrofolate reductase 1 [Devosia sp.]|nr:FolM Alternative dihydrofolate reductase 1 [Devosia sp.]
MPAPAGTAKAAPKVALVTGAADRLGAAMVRRLVGEDWAVVIHYRNSDAKAEALAETLNSSGGKAATVRADLADRKDRSRLIAEAGKKFGPLSLLVNNASIFMPDSVMDLDEALWDAHFRVHAEAPLFLARDFAAQLPDGVDGNIVNIIDERILHLTPNYFSYTLSKAVLFNATTTLAQSLAPRIRVNAIGPGPTLPEATQSEAHFQKSLAPLPLGRGATPDEIADALIFLVSSGSMTGQMLALDGGRHIDFSAKRGPTPRRPTSSQL